MIADFFTEPLQGSEFTEFRDEILNVKQIQQHQLCTGVRWVKMAKHDALVKLAIWKW